jgi:hypothetical protein
MKVEYQNEAFKEVISEEFVSKKFDAFTFQEKLRNQARDAQDSDSQFKSYIEASFKNIGGLVNRIMQRTPYRPGTADYKWLRMTLILNTLNSLSVKNKLSAELPTVVLWKTPKSSANYVRILLKELYSEIKAEILDCHHMTYLDDNIVDKLLQPPLEDYDNHEEQY